MCNRDCIVDQCTEDSYIITVYCICTKQQGPHPWAYSEPRGLRRTKMTESPRKNIFEMNRSRVTGFTLPLLPLGISVQISRTFSNTMLQWRSNALIRANSFLLLRTLMSTCVWFLTLCVRRAKGPFSNWSCSSFSCDYNLLLVYVHANLLQYWIINEKRTLEKINVKDNNNIILIIRKCL